jgi:HEAT repeat protein
VISTELLAIVMWLVIGAWLGTAVIIVVEFQSRTRQDARAADLLERLTASTLGDAESLPDVSPTEFQELVLAGLSDEAQVALATDLRTQGGDAVLLALVSGEKRASIDERIEALQILVSGRHPQMYTVLAAALRSPQPELATIALRLLRALNDEPSARLLIAALADDAHPASRVAAALNRMTVDYGALAGPLLLHESATVRFWALLLVGRIGASQWTSTVRNMLTAREPMVRRAAVEALGRLGSADDRHAIVECFFDPVPMVRVHAARASVAFADPTVADALTKLLGDREWIVRAAARDALRTLGSLASTSVMRMLWQGDPFAANNAAEVLFLTGETVSLIRDAITSPSKPERTRFVQHLVAASGPQILRAVNDQLDSGQQVALQELIERPESMAPIRRK